MEPASNYTPFDLSAIKRAKINSERELENEITSICATLKDTCKYSHIILL